MQSNPIYDATDSPLYDIIPNFTPLIPHNTMTSVCGQSERLHCSSTVSACAEFKLHLPLRPTGGDHDEYIQMTPSAVPIVTSPRYTEPPELKQSIKNHVVSTEKSLCDGATGNNDNAASLETVKYTSLL